MNNIQFKGKILSVSVSTKRKGFISYKEYIISEESGLTS